MQSDLSQLLHQHRDREHIKRLSAQVDSASNALVVKLRVRASVAASALSAQLDDLIAKRQKHIQELPDPILGAAVPSTVPQRPQLHFGRAAELEAVVAIVTATATAGRVAILGGPGMGKTTLAVAALHHPSVERSFGRSTYFVACDAANGLVSGSFRLIAEALGMTAPDKETAKDTLMKFFRGKRCLHVLDNFESAWESPEQREDAEELLQFLNSFLTLALVVTLRGAERPAPVGVGRFYHPCSH